ncbi:serine/threonine-protein kinase [Actinomycetospora straminea]|uniref:non-specific serine/threonine protein kinase n=1 Tax=Actinomycetospora straminea TaxID=663607 RepID=A0ABP9EVD0_9PSEU|nr:serine/threonine-protein kinase [Actinomycetospora straminea]MDD7935045.1 serine/threonine-protein kinase [Actinomycetospora straminea]
MTTLSGSSGGGEVTVGVPSGVPPRAGPPRAVLGPYVVQDVVHRGRSGEVLRAHDTAHDRVVALKLLAAEDADREYRARFDRSCGIARTLREPHVLPVLDYGETGGRLFVATPLLGGPDLGAVLHREEVLDPARAVAVVEQVARALAAAHARGLAHRNIKPANVVFTDPGAGELRVGDFGLVSRNGLSLDHTAPERFRGGATDHREDVYALGCVLYTCLTGARPYPGRSLPERMRGHLEGPIPRPSEQRRGVPAAFDAVVAGALAKTPGDRTPTVGTLAAGARAALA